MLRSMTLILGLGAALIACGGNAVEGDLDPTLANIQEYVFTPACATGGCHDALDRAGELDLSTAQVSYDSMVNVTSKNTVAKANGWIMIVPGDAERSFLVRKMAGPGPGEGDPMPSASQEVHPFYLELITKWIEEGAPR